MGKKVKKKARSGQKEKRGPSMFPKTVSQQGTSDAETPVNGGAVIKDRGLCSHIHRGINLDKLSAKLRSSEALKCEDCRGNVVDRRAKKGQGKHEKKGGANSKSESKAIWICLECGHYSCGGVGLPTTPQSHAVRHSKQNHHPLVVHYENHQLLWCFLCNKLVPVENSEDSKPKEVLNEVVKILKGQPGEGSNVDVEDVWFGSGSVTSAIKSDYSLSTAADERTGYSIKGLGNLGNTCYFNSVMQNILAINSLRDYFFKLDESVGPLSASVRKIFLEMCNEAGSKSVINPRSLFGSLCTKAPQFRGYQQHDSHELLRCLLDGLSTEESSLTKHTKSSQSSVTDPTFVDNIFGGQLSSTVSCLECGHSSTIYEPFLDLSLPVPTKKPPARRTQPATRGKKPKLPPKRSGRNLAKISRETNTLPRESIFDQSTGGTSSGEVHSIAQPAEPVVPSLGDLPFSDSSNPNVVALDMGLTAEDLSAIQNPQNWPAAQHVGEPSISSDDFTWLDYLEPDTVLHEIDEALETDEIPAIQDLTNEDVRQHDVSLCITSDSKIETNLVNAISAISLDNAKHFYGPDPGIIAQEQNAFSQCEGMQNEKTQFNGKPSPEGSFTEEVVQDDADIGRGSGSCSQVCSKDSNTSGRDSENTSQILGPNVMSCPSKEAASSSVEVSSADIEVPSTVLGDEQDSLDFDGFGDLFNEPEVSSGPSDHPVSGASDVTKIGVIGSTSESDPDEVDNADAPVSVESCLALFTKPEFLSKDEHAWQCDNCSKVLREQRIKSKKLQMPISDIVTNGCENSNQIGLLDIEKTCNTVKALNGNLEVDSSDGRSLAQNKEICENGKCMLANHPETGINATDFQLENAELLTKNACRGAPDSNSRNQTLNAYHRACDSDKDGFAESDLRSAKCESEVSEEEEVNSENLKVKRDATKGILISKAPPILTIHLKRFSQDARGRLSKLNGHVIFKETIDLKPYMDPRCNDKDMFTYRLVGVVEHLGTMRGGHYVAYVRGPKDYGDSVWYHASDAYVRDASLEEVLRCEAYILFYERT